MVCGELLPFEDGLRGDDRADSMGGEDEFPIRSDLRDRITLGFCIEPFV